MKIVWPCASCTARSPRAEPAVLGERGARLLRLVVVAARDQRAAELQLALRARLARRPGVGMRDAHLEARRRQDAGLQPQLQRLVEVVEERQRVDLRHPVGLERAAARPAA